MTKANKKSLEAKAYINGKVNDMREQYKKAPDEETRKKLVENFRKTTASEEYQDNLQVVHEDSDVIRKYARRKKGGDITPEEFKDAKTEFYGKNMNLELGEDFEKLDLGKKVDYIFEKFGDTDYAADLIINLLKEKLPKKIGNSERNLDLKIKNRLINSILNMNEREDTSLEYRFNDIERKFGRGPIALRLHLLVIEHLNGENRYTAYLSRLWDVGKYYKNITQNTLKYFAKGSNGAKRFLGESGIINSCEDGSISDHELIQGLGNNQINFKKLSLEGQKFFVDKFPKNAFVRDDKKKSLVIDKDINFLDEANIVEYVLNSLLRYYINSIGLTYGGLKDLNYFCRYELSRYKEYHEDIASILIKMGKIDIVKKYINSFTGLSENKKAEIMGNTELEDKLNNEKFDADLVKLQELGAKLGKEIVVKDIKKEEQKFSDESEETPQEPKKKKRKWFRNK